MTAFNIVSGIVKAPYFGVIYGTGGVGKTWLASYAEDPLFIPLEAGTNLVPAKKFDKKPKDIDEFFGAIKYLLANPTLCKTAVIDSGGFLETLIYADVILKHPTIGEGNKAKQVTSIGDYGYGHGYANAMDYWQKLLKGVDALQNKGMNVIFITHSHLISVPTDGGDSYKMHGMALQKFGSSDVPELMRRRSDWCLFMQSNVKTGKVKNQFGGSRTVAMAGSRPDVIVHTRATSQFFAKVRAAHEQNVQDYYEIDSNDIDGSSRKIFADLTNIG